MAVGPSVEVTKTAVPKFKRTYTWTIAKRVTDPSSGTLTLAPGQSYLVKYAVDLVGTPKDSVFRVEGTVTIKNTGSVDVVLQAPTDTLTPDGTSVPLACGVTFPYTLPAGQSLVCAYSQALPDGRSRTNTASVSWTGGSQAAPPRARPASPLPTPPRWWTEASPWKTPRPPWRAP